AKANFALILLRHLFIADRRHIAFTHHIQLDPGTTFAAGVEFYRDVDEPETNRAAPNCPHGLSPYKIMIDSGFYLKNRRNHSITVERSPRRGLGDSSHGLNALEPTDGTSASTWPG